MSIYRNVLEMIGHTPMLALTQFDTGPCELFLKLENQNPGGSIKDRIALMMINEAEKSGQIKPGTTLIEATAGNTGLGLALVAKAKGYRLLLVIPDKMSQEKIACLRAMGAEIVLTRSDVAKGHPEYYQDIAARLCHEMPNTFFINQFGNPANPLAHETTTAPEIWEQMDHHVDAIVCGVGSSGTISGLSQFFKTHAPHVEMIIADPEGSILADYIQTGELKEKNKSWLVEGIGEDFIPSICDLSKVTAAITVTDQQSFWAGRELLQKTGILGGSSSGTLLYAALQYCRAQTKPKRVVTFVCDTGNRYLSKMFNDQWMINQGLLPAPDAGDLRDLVANPMNKRATITVNPQQSIGNAHKLLQQYAISQVPVLAEQSKLLGIVSDSALLQAVVEGISLQAPVTTVLQQIPTLKKDAPLSQLWHLLQQHAAIAVTVDQQFYGLITRSDALNYFYRKEL